MLQFSFPSQMEPNKPLKFESQSYQNNMVSNGPEKSSKLLINNCPNKEENTSESKKLDKKLDVCKLESDNWLAQRMSKTENDTLNDVSTA